MHLVLTDWLVCPQCGPDQGLIVLAEQMQNRRVLTGTLGCPTCHRQYAIREGVADLRVRTEEKPVVTPPTPSLEPLQMAALLGLTDGRGYVLLLGSAGTEAAGLSALLPGIELIAVGAQPEQSEQAGVNQILADRLLPLRDRTVRGAVLGPGAPAHFAVEALRVLAVGGRLVISNAVRDAEALAQQESVRVLTRVADHIVVVRLH